MRMLNFLDTFSMGVIVFIFFLRVLGLICK